MRPKAAAPRQNSTSGIAGISEHRERIMATIANHGALSRRGLWGMLMFIAFSGLSLQLRGVDMFAGLSDPMLRILGSAPPAILIHAVLAVSTVSSLIIALGRLQEGEVPAASWGRTLAGVAFRSIFYLFYAVAGVLETTFPIVFAAGMIVLSSEYLVTWRYAGKVIKEEKAHLAMLR
jgi:hypothetical protein